jgi:LAO/AO transport system kinase
MSASRSSPAELVEAARTGDRRSLARLLSFVERGGPEAREVAKLVFDAAGSGYTVGLTGAPGAGKSTLVSALTGLLRSGNDAPRVAVLAVDPSSPFSGGAILGDRVRMGEHALDPGVYIRSMATRGHLGGLALAVPEAVRVLDALGFPWILLETVGVGQVEVDVAGAADTTVVVVNPGWGDAVQANKAGLMEIADIFVINKADRGGVRQTRHDLKAMLSLAVSDDGDDGAGGWSPPIVATEAETGKGVDELVEALEAHRRHLGAAGRLEARRAAQRRREFHAVVVERLRARAVAAYGEEATTELADAVAAREVDPYVAADRLLGPE